MKNKKKIIIICTVIVSISILICLFYSLKGRENNIQSKEDAFASELLVNFGNENFKIKDMNKVAKEKNYEDLYVLNEKSFLTNMSDYHLAKKTERKVYPKMAKKMQESVERGLKSDEKIKLVNESKNKKDITLEYEYSGPNLYMYQFDVIELSVLISYDMGKIVPMENIKNGEEALTHISMSIIQAMNIIEDKYEYYKKEQPRKIIVRLNEKKDTYMLYDNNNLLTQMTGYTSDRVGGKGIDYYDDTFVPEAKKRAKEYYEEAIKKGFYNPKEPYKIQEKKQGD